MNQILQRAYERLKANGLIDKIKDALFTSGKAAAIAICSKLISSETCSDVIDRLFNLNRLLFP